MRQPSVPRRLVTLEMERSSLKPNRKSHSLPTSSTIRRAGRGPSKPRAYSGCYRTPRSRRSRWDHSSARAMDFHPNYHSPAYRSSAMVGTGSRRQARANVPQSALAFASDPTKMRALLRAPAPHLSRAPIRSGRLIEDPRVRGVTVTAANSAGARLLQTRRAQAQEVGPVTRRQRSARLLENAPLEST